MYISNLSIRNFRNFRNASLDFVKGVNTVIGENGSGKTNLFHAIRILIDEGMPRRTQFYESDFSRAIGNWRGHWIIIKIRFAELGTSEEEQAIVMHKIGHADEFETGTGTYTVYFRPKENKRRELYEYSLTEDKDEDGLNDILGTISLNDYEVVFTGRGNIDFYNEENYVEYVGDFETISFPNPDDERLDAYGERIRGYSIPSELSCTFAKALRDVEADLRSYKDNPLLNLLRGKGSEIEEEKKTSIETQVSNLNKEISELEEVKKVSDGISNSVRGAVGETYAPTIKIQSELPSEIDKLMQSLKLLVGDPDEPDYQGKIWELSLGGANLIYLSLKLLEYERVKALDKVANFILIEEPEAHIHTHIQKTLFQKLGQHNTQIIISTHSTHVSSVSNVSSMNILSRGNKEAIVFNPARGLEAGEIMRVERYLDAVRTNLLFAKGVILVEGDAEQILIPALIRKVFGVTLDEIGITLVNVGSTTFENIACLFHKDRIRKRCAIITDLDASIFKLPKDEKNDTDEQKSSRNSQKSGAVRQEKINAFIKGNEWLNVFYAPHTFEVDFLMANNSYEVGITVDKSFKREGDVKKIIELVKNKKIEVSGKEILRLANKFGKGWFALMLAENIDHLSGVPEYILNALAFAGNNISATTKVSIAIYRIEQLSKRTYEGDEMNYSALGKKLAKSKTPETALELYKEELPKDVFTAFLNL